MLDEKALEELKQSIKSLESIERGDYIAKIQCENIKDNPIGRIVRELETLNQDFDKYRTEQAAEKVSDEERRKAERRSDRCWSILLGAISGTIASTIAGIIIYYWPSVIAFLQNFFQE